MIALLGPYIGVGLAGIALLTVILALSKLAYDSEEED